MPRTEPAHLVLIGDGSCRPFIGVHEVPGRLPELLRYPGESAQAFSTRALHAVQGRGALWARLMYVEVEAAIPLQGTTSKLEGTLRNDPEAALLSGLSIAKHYQ